MTKETVECCQQILGPENLKDNEATKWAKLSLDFAPVVLSNEADSLTWLPSADGVFSTKSLIMDMEEKVEATNHMLAKTVWEGH